MIRNLKTFIRAYIWYSLKSLNVTFLTYGQLVTEILHFKICGTQCVVLNAVWVLFWSLTICCIRSFKYFTSVSNFKAIGLLLMEILHFNDFVDIHVVSFGCQRSYSTARRVSNLAAKYLRVYLPSYTI